MNERSKLIGTFENTLNEIEIQAKQNLKLHEVEGALFKQVLALGLQILTYYLSIVCRESLCSNTIFLTGDKGVKGKYVNKGKSTRTYQSVFGAMSIERFRYYSKTNKCSIYPLDRKLGLSESGMSYLLQDWLPESSTQLVYEKSIGLLNKVLNLSLKGMQVLRINESIHEKVVDFYQDKKPDQILDEEGWPCISYDGKGIPIRAEEVNRQVESSGDRLSRGQKHGVKKEVTVSANYLSEKRIQTPEQVIQSFFSTDKQEDSSAETKKEHQHKHLRGFLSNQKEAVKYGLKRLAETVPANKKFIVLIDGCRGLEKAVDLYSQELGIADRVEAKILDFVHVTEYVWKVANAILGEKNAGRSAWVRNYCLTVLKGDAEAIMQEWEAYLLAHQKLSEGKKKSIQSAVTYFKNHLHMMRYDEYLKKGMPIATGVVESACGHFIQQRFDTNGMRWTLEGAQALIDLKAISINGDWKEMMDLYIKKEQLQLYGHYQKVAA